MVERETPLEAVTVEVALGGCVIEQEAQKRGGERRDSLTGRLRRLVQRRDWWCALVVRVDGGSGSVVAAE